MLKMLRMNVGATQNQLVQYVNSTARVSLYATGVIQNAVPGLLAPLPYYSAFAGKFASIKTTALIWPNAVEAQMMALPQSLINFNALFNLESQTILALTQKLQADPKSQPLRSQLTSSLQKLEGNVRGQTAATTSLLGMQQNFATALDNDAGNLSQLASQALAAASAEKRTTIQQINAGINVVQNELDALSRWLDAIKAAEITSLVFECVGILMKLLPEGGDEISEVVEKLAAMAHDASELEEIFANKLIAQANQDIQTQRAELALFEQDIALLNGLNQQFQRLVTTNQAAKAAIANIAAFWSTLSAELNRTMGDLTRAGPDIGADQFKQAEADIQQAIAEWQAVEDFADSLSGITFQHPGTVINLPPAK